VNIIAFLWNKLDRLARKGSGVFRRNYFRRRFPGLDAHPNATLQVRGEFVYGAGCSICEGATIIVEAGSRLVLGDNVTVMKYTLVHAIAGVAMEIGDETSLQERCSVIGNVRLGRAVIFAPNVFVSSGGHFFDVQPELFIRDQDDIVVADAERLKPFLAANVTVEDDCWLGINTAVMTNIVIHKGCVVGSNAVVTKSLPPYRIAAGSPAKVVKQRLYFQPPQEIHWYRLEDLPYFYEGCGVRRHEREQHQDGIAVGAAWSVWLDTEDKTAVVVRAKVCHSGHANQCWIECNGVRYMLTEEFTEYTFPLAITTAGTTNAANAGRVYFRCGTVHEPPPQKNGTSRKRWYGVVQTVGVC
jgi:acetyltransferase-like isoleucine patch superfamily enzyme